VIPISKAMKVVGKALSDNSPKILTGMAVTGVITTAILTGKAAYKTGQYVADLEEELTPREVAREVYKDYIPAAAMGIVTAACIIGANSIHSRRQAALMSAYSLVDTAFHEYKDKVVEEMGKNREQKVYDDIAQERVAADKPSHEVIITGEGGVLCLDMFSGRYFRNDMQTIRAAVNDINYKLNNDAYASLNDFWRLIGLPATDVGEELGWTHEELMELVYTTALTPEDKPCLAIQFRKLPKTNYYKLW
jgi:hypothetical protein